jgi:hypothetical protein
LSYDFGTMLLPVRKQIAQKCVVNSPPRDVDIGGEIA